MAETPSGSKSNPINKPALRTHFIQIRRNLSQAQREFFSGIIRKKILSHPKIHQARTIAIYISTKSEVDTHALIENLLEQKKELYAPVVIGDSVTLHKLESLGSCIPGPKNILEPPSSAPKIDPRNVDLFIVPGLGFDSQGNRLGYGKGYYDQLLTTAPGYKLAISYTDQLCYQLPHEPHDIKMNQIITNTISLQISF